MLYSEDIDKQLGGGRRQGADQEAKDAADQEEWVLDHDGDDHDAVDHGANGHDVDDHDVDDHLMTTRSG